MNSKYKNKKSVVLENSRIRAEFIPEPGGKMASLINKETGYEFLLQRKNTIYREQPFEGVFVDSECSGYDDMFPTIDTCNYEDEPWAGIKMADHGEVWSLPWKYAVDDLSLHMSVEGVRFPYKLEKNIYFKNENSIRLDYTLTNYSPYDFKFLWAGHLMINIEEGVIVKVPDDCKQVTTILTNGNGKFGDIHNWPDFTDKDGKSYRADVSRPKDSMGFEKYYFNNMLKDGWCQLIYPDNKNRLKVSFPVETVPYLGILMNEGGWDGLYNIIIEPCTVCYDRPDVARKYGQVCIVKGSGVYTWHIEIMI
jgi:hypothetical protein